MNNVILIGQEQNSKGKRKMLTRTRDRSQGIMDGRNIIAKVASISHGHLVNAMCWWHFNKRCSLFPMISS